MTEPITALFERADAAGDTLPAPELDGVRRRGRQLRTRRRGLAATAVGCVLLTAVGVVRLAGSGERQLRVPAAGTAITAPAGANDRFLQPADLGSGGWVVGAEPGDSGPRDGVDQPGCGTGSETTAELTVPGTGSGRILRGSTPEGGEWLVDESVITFADKDVEAVRRAFLAGMKCSKLTGGTSANLVLAANDTMLITGVLLDAGSVGYAHGYAIVGTTWISIETLPGGATGGIPLPGQTQWLIDVTATAARRATGQGPIPPSPNAAARAAAAKYVAPDPSTVLHVQSQAPGASVVTDGPGSSMQPPDAGPTTPSAAPAPPKGFLTLSDLGGTGGWTLSSDGGDRTTSRDTPITLPACGGQVGSDLRGEGGSQLYRGQTQGGSGEWILNETVIMIPASQRSALITRFAELAGCTKVTGSLGTGTPRVPGAPDTLVVGYPLASGTVGFAQAWAVVGDQLILLDTLPGGAAGHAPLPGGTGWLADVLKRAQVRVA
jgi:hypothetical protein